MISLMTLILLLTLLVLPYIYLRQQFSYWKSRNIPYITPLPIFGNLLEIFLLKRNIGEHLLVLYRKSKEPLIGIFMLHRPALLIRDPELIKYFVIKNFDNFQNRSIANAVDDEKYPDFATSLIVSKYDTWKIAKKAVSPSFSYSKLKAKHGKIREIAEKMSRFIEENRENNEINMRDVCVRYGVETACISFFEIEAGCFENDEPFFKRLTRRLFDYRVFDRGVHIAMTFISPEISKNFGFHFVDKIAGKELVTVLEDELKNRKIERVEKEDFLEMLGTAAETFTGKGNLITGAAETFVAGYEGVSSSLEFAFYELAKNQEIQSELRQSIMAGVDLYDYEQLDRITYLDSFIKELLRMYPIVPFVDRVCTKSFQMNNPNVIIEEGISVYIPTLGIHYDPEYYPDPYKFSVERFQDANINWKVYLPFGKGPRMCPGKKYAEIKLKICLATILTKFVVKFSPKSPKKMRFNTKGFSLQPEGDVFLKLESLER